MTKIYLLRHAQSLGNLNFLNGYGLLPKTKYGSPLSELGKQQAKQLVTQLAGLHFDAIYSSHLQRSLDSAKEIAASRGIKITVSEDLQEIDEDSEDTEQALNRFLKALDRISSENDNKVLLIIVHGVLLKFLLHYLLPSEFKDPQNITIDNLASVNIEYSGNFKILSCEGVRSRT